MHFGIGISLVVPCTMCQCIFVGFLQFEARREVELLDYRKLGSSLGVNDLTRNLHLCLAEGCTCALSKYIHSQPNTRNNMRARGAEQDLRMVTFFSLGVAACCL